MKTRIFCSGTVLASAAGIAMLAPVSVLGQVEGRPTEISEILVTAQRRAEAQVDVPISVVNLGPEQLQAANVQQLTDISKITPSLRFDNAGAFWQPTIRGIGTAVTTSGGGGNVGIYVDGFYSPNPLATNMELMNVQSIQVLKGPQGTLFGRNTTGGAILIQSVEPSTEAGGEVRLSYGRFNEARTQAYYTFGLSDTIALDAEGLYSRGDGWQRNISNDKRVGDYENWSVRLGLKADLTDSVSLLLRYQHSRIDDPSTLLTASYFDPEFGSAAPFFAQPGEVTFRRREVATGSHPNDQEFFRSENDVLQATLRVDLGFADFTSYSQYRGEDVDASIELDYSGVELLQLGLPNDNETWTQEFLLTSKPGAPLQWTSGLFYFSNRDTYIVFFDYAPGFGITERSDFSRFGSSTTTRSYAAFLDATYEVTPQLFITAGVRYAEDRIDDAWYIDQFTGGTRNYVKDVNPDGYQAARRSNTTPRFVVRYKPTDRSSLYASYTRGYKAALLDVGGGGGNFVKPEKVDAFEVGFKYDAPGLSLETSAFYYDYQDLQVSLFRTGQAQIINAATSEIKGVDGQVRFDLSDNLQINAGAAWVHARYKRFQDAPIYEPCVPILGPEACGAFGATFLITPTNLRNVTMQRTPEFTGNIGGLYRTDLAGGELLLSGNLFYSSKFYFGPSGVQFPQKAYEVLSLRAQWTDPSDTYRIALWGDNLTDKKYKTQVQYNQPGMGVNWSKPITFGVEVGAKF